MRDHSRGPELNRDRPGPPHFSIIIPTYRRPRALASCLQSLTRLEYSADRFEVIVVDDGSPTSPEGVASFRDRLDVTLLTQAHKGPAAARNAGAARARADFLAFTDDDCTPAPNWLQALAARFTAAPDCAVGGRKVNALPQNPYSTASQLVTDVAFAYFNVDRPAAGFFSTSNLAVPAARFRTLGGFDPSFTTAEDREFCDRWRHHGYGTIFAPEVVVLHAHALTLRSFWRQHFNAGRGARRFHRTRMGRGSGRLRPDPGFYLELLRYPITQSRHGRAWLLTALVVVAQIANTAGFFCEWGTRGAPTAGQRCR